MKSLVFPVLMLVILKVPTEASASDVTEVNLVPQTTAYLAARQHFDSTDPEMAPLALESIHKALGHTTHADERFALIFWGASFQYSLLDQPENILNVLMAGIREGLFFPLITGEKTWPPYLSSISGLNGYARLIDENNRLRAEAENNPTFEYVVRTPESIQQGKTYPLIVVFHGGFGSHHALSEDWISSLIRSEYIIAYMQGSVIRASHLRSYGSGKLSSIQTAYERVIDQYPVNRNAVILAAQSAGNQTALDVAVKEVLPTAGLLLAFPSVPDIPSHADVKRLSDHGTRAVFLLGEKDVRFERQVSLAKHFESAGIPTEIYRYSEIGHEFPQDLETQLDRALSGLTRQVDGGL